MTNCIQIYTDGSSRGNPGPGGFGIVMKFGTNEKTVSKGYRLTTNYGQLSMHWNLLIPTNTPFIFIRIQNM
jgi:hypothetical protein